MDRKNILRDYEFTREDYVFVEAVMSQHARDLTAKAEEKKQELLRYKKSMSEDMSRAIESILIRFQCMSPSPKRMKRITQGGSVSMKRNAKRTSSAY